MLPALRFPSAETTVRIRACWVLGTGCGRWNKGRFFCPLVATQAWEAFRRAIAPLHGTTHSRVPNSNEKSADFCEICIVFWSRFLRGQILGTFYLRFCGVPYRPCDESAPKNCTELGFSCTFLARVWHSPWNGELMLGASNLFQYFERGEWPKSPSPVPCVPALRHENPSLSYNDTSRIDKSYCMRSLGSILLL